MKMPRREMKLFLWKIAMGLLLYDPLHIVDVHWKSGVGLSNSGLSHKVIFLYQLKVGRGPATVCLDQKRAVQGQVKVCLGRARASLDRIKDGSEGCLVSKKKSMVWKEVRVVLRRGKSERY
jgi:hypothetical protein